MITDFDCGDCGMALRTVPVIPDDDAWVAGLKRLSDGPYEFLYLRCTQCGASWARDGQGQMRSRHPVAGGDPPDDEDSR